MTVTLDVQAETPSGAPDHVVRTVTENSRIPVNSVSAIAATIRPVRAQARDKVGASGRGSGQTGPTVLQTLAGPRGSTLTALAIGDRAKTARADGDVTAGRLACTRARDRLLVTGVAPASEFLDDLRR